MPEPIIAVEGLFKTYNSNGVAVEAVRGLSFSVQEGEVFGLLGPNGAGKTTTVEILEGMRTPDRGTARVCGLDPEKAGSEFKQKIGAVLQSTSLPDKLRVKEALDLFANFYTSRADTESLLKRFQLEEKRDAFYSQLSGGQKQRLALAMALVNNPQVVFLDEPTAGLDPQVRREIYDIIEELRKDKKTVLITTHYIEEAERLCDRVAIVDYGRIIKTGTPRELKHSSAGTTRIEVRLARPLTNGVLSTLEGVADCRDFDGTYVHPFHASAAHHRRAGKATGSGKQRTAKPGNVLALSRRRLHRADRPQAKGLTKMASNVFANTWTLTKVRVRLAMRNRTFLFFSLFMPLGFLFFFVMVFSKGDSPWTAYILGSILTMTVMGSFWGLSVQLVTFREAGILRRFRLAPRGRRPHARVQHSGELHPGSSLRGDRNSGDQVGSAHAIVGQSVGDVPAGYRWFGGVFCIRSDRRQRHQYHAGNSSHQPNHLDSFFVSFRRHGPARKISSLDSRRFAFHARHLPRHRSAVRRHESRHAQRDRYGHRRARLSDSWSLSKFPASFFAGSPKQKFLAAPNSGCSPR